MSLKIITAPGGIGEAVLGVTIPQLLDEAVEKHPNAKAFNNPTETGWKTLSNAEFRTAADEVALGLHEVGLERGGKVAFFMNSDMYFSMADFGTLTGGIINVPLYTTYTEDNLVYVTKHAECKAIFVSNPEMLAGVAGWISQTPDVKTVILAEGDKNGSSFSDGIRVLTLDELRDEGKKRLAANPSAPADMRAAIDPHDVASFIYTSGTTGLPKGVMLTHENISSNVYGSFHSIEILDHQEEVALTFLPLTHIFARMLAFAHVAWGHCVYYTDPDRLVGHLAEVRPTVFASVPRVLEKVYDRVLQNIQNNSGLQKTIGLWAMNLASQIELGSTPSGLQGVQYRLADKLVYSKLRERLGLTRVKAVAVGGAALRQDLCSFFPAIGVPVFQGYGLTETSPVISVGTPKYNIAGTVGPPIIGVEVAIAEDGEILTRGPHIMKGYYKDEPPTSEVIDSEGWLHTGDIGEIVNKYFLKITDRKKALFKLSTGKYVIPQPLENNLTQSPLIEQAVLIGVGRQYTSALLFPSMDALQGWVRHKKLDVNVDDTEKLLKHPEVLRKFERLVAEANKGMDKWIQVKRFSLIPELMEIESGLLTPSMKVKRKTVADHYASEIEAIYAASVDDDSGVAAVA